MFLRLTKGQQTRIRDTRWFSQEGANCFLFWKVWKCWRVWMPGKKREHGCQKYSSLHNSKICTGHHCSPSCKSWDFKHADMEGSLNNMQDFVEYLHHSGFVKLSIPCTVQRSHDQDKSSSSFRQVFVLWLTCKWFQESWFFMTGSMHKDSHRKDTLHTWLTNWTSSRFARENTGCGCKPRDSWNCFQTCTQKTWISHFFKVVLCPFIGWCKGFWAKLIFDHVLVKLSLCVFAVENACFWIEIFVQSCRPYLLFHLQLDRLSSAPVKLAFLLPPSLCPLFLFVVQPESIVKNEFSFPQDNVLVTPSNLHCFVLSEIAIEETDLFRSFVFSDRSSSVEFGCFHQCHLCTNLVA